MGTAEKQVQHDVREIVTCAAVLLQNEHHQESPREETDLQVRGMNNK